MTTTPPFPTTEDMGCINGRALRRLKKRFPDLEARLAEVELPLPERLSTGGATASPRVGGGAEPAAGGVDGAVAGNFRVRVSRWLGKARQVVGRGRER